MPLRNVPIFMFLLYYQKVRIYHSMLLIVLRTTINVEIYTNSIQGYVYLCFATCIPFKFLPHCSLFLVHGKHQTVFVSFCVCLCS